MKKLILFALALVLTSFAFAGLYTLGDGTSNQYYIPVYGSYDYSWNKVIYTAAELQDLGVPAGEINGLGYYASRVPNAPYEFDEVKVFIRHTDASAATTTYPNNTQFQEVYHGDFIVPEIGWHYFMFSNPFVWDGEDNIEILIENYTGYWQSDTPSYLFHSTAPEYLAAHHFGLDFFPTGQGTLYNMRPNTRFFTETIQPPSATLVIKPKDGAVFVPTNSVLNWEVNPDATGYKIYFGETNPPAFLADVVNNNTYYPVMEEGTKYYWQVVPYNSFGDAEDCPIWSFTSSPSNLVIMGDGTTAQNYVPIQPGQQYSVSQTVYDRNMINVSGRRIEQIAYYWNAKNTGVNNDDWSVYMTHTDVDTFASPNHVWIPLDQYTQVYSGNPIFPTTEGWMVIDLDAPFAYNGTQNLVIMVVENSPGNTSGGSFIATSATARSLRYQAATPINPASIPSRNIVNYMPNTALVFGDLTDEPEFAYSPSSLDFGLLQQENPSGWKNVSITNVGSGTLNLSVDDISIFGENATMFEINPQVLPVALGSGESHNIPVRATVTEEGEVNATLRFVYDMENYDVALSAEGLPAGVVLLGDGLLTARYPLGSYYGYERSAALYTAAELGVTNKRINRLSWYATVAAAPAVPTKIYLKAYNTDTIGVNNWAGFISGATLVYDGVDTSIAANDWHHIVLDNSFDLDSGNNLLVLVERNWGGTGSSAGITAPALRSTNMTGMHHTLLADNNAPVGNSVAQSSRPNLMLMSDTFTITAPPNPAIIAAPADGATLVELDAQLRWTSGGGGPSGYKLYLGENNPPELVATLGLEYSYNLNLEYSTTYYWQIVPFNSFGDAVDCPIWSFTTKDDPVIRNYPFVEGFEEYYTNGARIATYWEQFTGPQYTTNYWAANYQQTTYNRTPRTGDWNAVLQSSSHATLVRPIQLEAGNLYLLSFYARQDGPYPDFSNIQALLGNAPTLAALTTPITPLTGLVNGDYQAINGAFQVESSGIYYIGIKGWMNGSPHFISMDDLQIIEIPAGPVAAPHLDYPANGQQRMPVEGFPFEFSWNYAGPEPAGYDLMVANVADLPANYNVDDFFATAISFENANSPHTPEFDDPDFYQYSTRYAWTVVGYNDDYSQMEFMWPPYEFVVEDDPTIREFPWTDSFEDYADFSLDIYPWSQYDGDGMPTYGITSYSFPNQYYTGSYIVFNPDATTPVLNEVWEAYDGNKYLAAFSANGSANNDWLISPPLETTTALNFSFRARSVISDYGLERFRVLVSTTDKNPASFTQISAGDYISAPVDWTKYEYVLNYPNQTIFVAIQCISDDAFTFMVDDVQFNIPNDLDLAIAGFSGNNLGNVNHPAYYDVTVSNVGQYSVGSFTLYLKDAATDAILAEKEVTELLASAATTTEEIFWTPTMEGDFNVYAEIVVSGDANLTNNRSNALPIKVMSENMKVLLVGDPQNISLDWSTPFNFLYEDSVVETIYLASEMQNRSGTIEALTYISYFNAYASDNFQIWMKNTDVNNLNSGWLPFDGYTLVYEGPISAPADVYFVELSITPFTYTGGNLAIRTSRVWNGTWSNNKYWLATVDNNYMGRTRIYFADTNSLDHTNPPLGNVYDHIPDIYFFIDTDELVTVTDSPELSISMQGNQTKLQWQPVDYAYSYNVYESDNPYAFEDAPIATLYKTNHSITTTGDSKFYRVSSKPYRDLVRGIYRKPRFEQHELREIEKPVFKLPYFQKTK